MRHVRWILVLAALAAPAAADLLETRDGRVLDGIYLGGTEEALRFKVGDEVQVFLVDEVVQVRFTGPSTRAGTRPKASPGVPTSRLAAPPAPARPAPPGARPPGSAPAPAPAPAQASTPAPTQAAAAPSQSPAPAPAASVPAPEASSSAAPASPAPRFVRVDAGTRLRVRVVDGIDSHTCTVGDRFAATLETGLGLDGVPILPAGTKLYGQVAELRATGPVASRLKLELTQLMLGGQLFPIVTGPHQLDETESAGPASAATIPARPAIASGSRLEFRLLQPFEIRVP